MTRTYTPGYCVVEQPGTLDFQARMLFQDYKSQPKVVLVLEMKICIKKLITNLLILGLMTLALYTRLIIG